MESVVGSFEGKNVLEIGFGRGELISLFIENRVNFYHGIDFSSAAFEIASRYSGPKIKLETKEAVELDEGDVFDIILMNHVIEHIPTFEMDALWKKIKRLLSPSGFIILGTPLYENPNVVDQNEITNETMGMYCNKQTPASIVKICDDLEFSLNKWEDNYFALKNGLNDTNETIKKTLMNQGKTTEAGRLLIGCVAENNPKYQRQALNLVKSIRWFGGEMAGSNIFVCVVDEADPWFVKELQRWGAFVRVVQRFSDIHPPSNKFRFLELAESEFYDTIILMDCDTVLVEDPFKYIKGDKFQATMAGKGNISHETFKGLFEHYNLELPNQEFVTTITGVPTIWYCNAGVLIFPKNILKSFLPVWKDYVFDLYINKSLLRGKFFFCEQVALTLAYFSKQIPFEELPTELNFHLLPTNQYTRRHSYPYIIHYHKLFDSNGFLSEMSHDPKSLEMVQKFNTRLRQELTEQPFSSPAMLMNKVNGCNEIKTNNLIVTGIPRSGTTLTTALIDSLENTICLSEPPWQGQIFKKTENISKLVKRLKKDFIKTRENIINKKPIEDRRSESGNAVTNYIQYTDDGKAVKNKHSNKFILEAKDHDFLLGMKQNAQYSSILPALAEDDFFSIIAVVRHPIPTILSWQKVNFPISKGRLPGAELFWPEIKSISKSEEPLLIKQVRIFDLFCERYLSLGDRICLIKYEQLLDSPAILEMITKKQYNAIIDLTNQNKNRHYDFQMVNQLKDHLKLYAPNALKLYSLDDY
ncbi:class I SAM-dependent methyltransferase [Peribacillus sp. SCS-155]|uniref:class I SAM-dependent methyltransferase n=1 Tax=Peribacillus sedimenti TaxID=3115297 RepID=UPI0039069EB5